MSKITENGFDYLTDLSEYDCKMWIESVYSCYHNDSRFKIKLKDRRKTLVMQCEHWQKVYKII